MKTHQLTWFLMYGVGGVMLLLCFLTLRPERTVAQAKEDKTENVDLLRKKLQGQGLVNGVLDLLQRTEQLENKLKEVEQEVKQTRQQIPPLGSIVAWHRDIGKEKLVLPEGWVLCDGKEIKDGPLHGMKTPLLNDAGRQYGGGCFLRGGEQSGQRQEATSLFNKWEGQKGAAVPGDDSQFSRNADGIIQTRGYWDAVTTTGTVESNTTPFVYVRPVNMSVIWIMRVK